MDPRRNPFTPSAGAKPPAFAGRDRLIEDADIAFDRILGGLHANGRILLGLRGVGKIVLLNALHDNAAAKGFNTIRFEVRDRSGGNLARALVPELALLLRHLDRKEAAGHRLRTAMSTLQGFAAIFKVRYDGLDFGVAAPESIDMLGDLERDLPLLLTRLLGAAKERDTALALFIDEVQYLSNQELSSLARACHEVNQRGLPFLLIATGLPQIAALAGEAKSYAERLFEYPEVGALDRQAAEAVLRDPSMRQGADFTVDAVDRIFEATKGYAYFLQTWGKHCWDIARGPTVEADDVAEALPTIEHDLDQSFFRVRFDQCSPAEQRYLRGMAELGPGPHQTGDIGAALDTKSSTVAPVRKKLIGKGMIYSQRYGETAFTVPLFDRFMKRAMPEMRPYVARRAGE